MLIVLHDMNKWLRVIGDAVFEPGTVALNWFIFGLKFGWSVERK
jgi:hypothetical protein